MSSAPAPAAARAATAVVDIGDVGARLPAVGEARLLGVAGGEVHGDDGVQCWMESGMRKSSRHQRRSSPGPAPLFSPLLLPRLWRQPPALLGEAVGEEASGEEQLSLVAVADLCKKIGLDSGRRRSVEPSVGGISASAECCLCAALVNSMATASAKPCLLAR